LAQAETAANYIEAARAGSRARALTKMTALDASAVAALLREFGQRSALRGGNPWRLDLDWRWHETALRLGCMMSINPDAHSTREIDLTHWGVEMARKGGVPKERVLNCLNKEEFAEYLANRRDQRRGKRLAPGRRIPRTRTVRAKAKKASLAARKKRSVAS
jgi:hypothetical protein